MRRIREYRSQPYQPPALVALNRSRFHSCNRLSLQGFPHHGPRSFRHLNISSILGGNKPGEVEVVLVARGKAVMATSEKTRVSSGMGISSTTLRGAASRGVAKFMMTASKT